MASTSAAAAAAPPAGADPATTAAPDPASLGRFRDLWRSPAPVVLQTESAECGLACLAMVLGAFGVRTDLRQLRQRHVISINGTTLASLARMAATERLNSRAVRLELHELPQLRLPCILHWDLSHFVVLVRADADGIDILDPAQGERRIPASEIAERFSGVAMELWPAPDLDRRDERERLGLKRLVGRVAGLRPVLARIVGLSLALEVFALVAPLLMQWVTDQVLVARDTHLLAVVAIGFLMLGLLRATVSLVRGWVLATAASSLRLQWHSNVMDHLLSLPTAWFGKRQLGDIVSRMRSVDHIQSVLTGTFVAAALDGLMSVLACVLMLMYSPRLAAVAGAGVVAYGLVRWAAYGPLRLAREDQLVREARQTSHVLESIRGVRTLKLFERQRERLTAWQGLMSAELRAGLKVEALGLSAHAALDVISTVTEVAVVALGALEVIEGRMTLGMLLAFMAYRSQFSGRMSELVGRFVELRMMRLDMERLADIVLTPPEAVSSTAGHRFGRHDDLTIALEQVEFRYAQHEPVVLGGVSLRIAPGELVAITGPSGGGKSTLVSVILGDLTPTAGRVRIGTQPLEPAWLAAWRREIGTVLQDDLLFAGTIAENIACFEPEADLAHMMRCIRAAAFDEDLRRLPMGLQSLVGDMGTSLSGGQRQRVLLARALYKRPRVLVLDEATSHLDVDREMQVMASLAALRLTRIVVAHRPETVASADRVIELRDGGIVYDGVPGRWLERVAARRGEDVAWSVSGAGTPAGIEQPEGPSAR